MTEPTTAEIRERHEELQGDIENLWDQCRGTPDASMDEELIAHQDRGILLGRLEAAEQTIAALPCYRQWFWADDEDATCAHNDIDTENYCPACKAALNPSPPRS